MHPSLETEAPLSPMILFWKSKIPIRLKAAFNLPSALYLLPSALALFAGSINKNFKSGFPHLKIINIQVLPMVLPPSLS